MSAQLLPAKPTADMLVLADRNFCGFKLWRIACAGGAKLAWRVKSNLGLPVQPPLADGSYLSTVFDSADRARLSWQVVRVIDCTLRESATPTQDSYRLVTNILDPQAEPALELAALRTRTDLLEIIDDRATNKATIIILDHQKLLLAKPFRARHHAQSFHLSCCSNLCGHCCAIQAVSASCNASLRRNAYAGRGLELAAEDVDARADARAAPHAIDLGRRLTEGAKQQ